MGNKFKYGFIALTALCIGSAVCANTFHHKEVSASATTRTVLIDTTHPISDSKVVNGSQTYWFTGNSSSGITFDTSNAVIKFQPGGYIQNLSAINGITSVECEVRSGHVVLQAGFTSPSALETPMYETDISFGSTKYFTFENEKPTYIRFLATCYSNVNYIRINYSGQPSNDIYSETLNDGLENMYVDCGTLNKYANVAFSKKTAEEKSGRSLKIWFENTTNNYLVLNPQRDLNAGNLDSLLDFSNSTISFKAKFSSNISNKQIRLKAVNRNWGSSSYINTKSSDFAEDGWYTFTSDLSEFPFVGNSEVIRINFYFDGITTSNKATSHVYIDQIKINKKLQITSATLESIADGLENSTINVGETSFAYSYDQENTFGLNSKSSLKLVPTTYKSGWTLLSYFASDGHNRWTLNEGVLSFNYKPINISHPEKVLVRLLRDWDTKYKVEKIIFGTPEKDGWYTASLDLATYGLYDDESTNIYFGWMVGTINANSRIFLDNVKITESSFENFNDGWENMERDKAWEQCNATFDPAVTSSDYSRNSLKMTFEGKDVSVANKGGCVIAPQMQKIQLPTFITNQNTLSAKFLFSSEITDFRIRVTLVSQNWAAARYIFNPTFDANGWGSIVINKDNLSNCSCTKDAGFSLSNIIRIGFGFYGVTNSNKATATVWLDDVLWYGNLYTNPSNFSSGTIYKTPNSELVLRDDPLPSYPTRMNLTSTSALTFYGAKNSVEGAQLHVKAGSAEIKNINFLIGKLRANSGAVLPSNCFEVLFAKYIDNDGSTETKITGDYSDFRARKGLYPDALVPMQNIIDANENKIPANCDQTFWVNVNIPKNIPSGYYNGTGLLILNSIAYTIQIQVIVSKATLTDTNHAKSAFLIDNEQIEFGEGTENYNAKLRCEYYNFVVDHRLNPDGYHPSDKFAVSALKSPTYTGDTFGDFIYKNVVLNERVSSYRIPLSNYKKATTLEYYNFFDDLINKTIELANQGTIVDLFEPLYIYNIDEPDKDEIEAQVWNESVRRKNEAIRICSSRLNNWPELKHSLETIPYIIPYNQELSDTDYNSYVKNKIDTPCPTFKYFQNTSRRNAYLNDFNQIWWYGCISPTTPYSSLHADAPAYSCRTAAWMQYYYGIDGELYWSVTYNVKKESEEERITDWDPWNGVGVIWGDCCGDGRLVYPGQKYGVYGPITTIRMEQLRMSRQEYEYLYDLDHNIDAYNRVNGSNYANVQSLLATKFNAMFNGVELKKTFDSTSMNGTHIYLLDVLSTIY